MKVKSTLTEAVLEASTEPAVKKEGKYKRKKRSGLERFVRFARGDWVHGGGKLQSRDANGRWD